MFAFVVIIFLGMVVVLVVKLVFVDFVVSGASPSFCHTKFATAVLAVNGSWRCHHTINAGMLLSARHDIKVVETDAHK